MLEKIREALKKAGMDISHAEKLAGKVTDESNIDAAVAELRKELNKEMTPDQFKKYLEDNGLAGVLDKAVQSEFDRKITKALETHEKTLREKGLLKDKADDKSSDKNKPGDNGKPDNPELAELRDLIKKQGETIEQLAGAKKQSDRLSLVSAALKKAELPEALAGTVTGDTPELIETSVKLLKDNITTIQQKRIDELLKQHGLPLDSKGSSTPTEDAAIALAKKANEKDKQNIATLNNLSIGVEN